ncbi:glucan endo-1,3-beta-glucosidase-like [Corylus avellana]|uniref:glucan endo-1,3-beta-glucosidase-like n=1 Tax=Corylus avellana TaxID=13451 RepID=UPI00286B36FF|nr:glucan endo-1,3-beta-glucosidase-like [Corylus avellana]
MSPTSMIWITVLSMAVFHHSMVFGGDLGINYGRTGNDLPSPKAVVDFLTKNLNYAIPLVRLFDANLEFLEALRGTNLVVTVGVPNVLLTHIASSQNVANSWVNDHIKSFVSPNGVKLSTFNQSYPYFAFASDPSLFSLEYASFRCQKLVLIDGIYEYYKLFDAMVDAFVTAMARAVGKEDVKIVVSETGWPTEGNEPCTSIANANIYNSNLKKHVIEKGCTPRRADLNLEAYINSMFNEN